MELATIGIGTYNRIYHLKQTFEFLKKNTLSKKSKLYQTDKNLYKKIRKYHLNLLPTLKLTEKGELKAGEAKITFNLI